MSRVPKVFLEVLLTVEAVIIDVIPLNGNFGLPGQTHLIDSLIQSDTTEL